MGPSSVEARQLARVPCKIVVSRADGRQRLGEIRNLSFDGLFIETGDPLPEGSLLALTFSVSDGHPVTAEAEVVHRARDGMGLRFLRLSPADGRRLRRYVNDVTSIVAHREMAARLLDASEGITKPVRAASEIRRLLTDSRTRQVTHTLVSGSRSLRTKARVSALEGEHLVYEVEEPSGLERDEQVFVLYTLEFVSFSFESRVLESDETRMTLVLPDVLHYSERRSGRRVGTESTAKLTVPLPGAEGAKSWSVLETSPGGLSFRADPNELYFLPGTPLTGAVLAGPELETGLQSPIVKHVTVVREQGESPWLKVGVSHGVERAGVSVSREPVTEQRRRGRLGRLVSFGQNLALKVTAIYQHKLKRSSTNRAPMQIVRFANRRGHDVVGLLNVAFEGSQPVRAPLVIITPGYGGRKETMSALAMTLLHNFRRQHQDLAVLRIDGTNNLGESYKDPGCTAEGRHTLHYTVSGAVEDVIGALTWAKSNRFVDPSDVILVSVSFSSVAVRRALTAPEASSVSRWFVLMGAADAQNGVLNVSGNIDIYGNYLRGMKTGSVSLVGCLVDADHFCTDLETLGAGTLDDARREMTEIAADITWVIGKHDAFMDPRRVHDVMSAKAKGAREVIEVDAGHVPKSGDEALAQFVLVAKRLWRHLYGSEIAATVPPRAWLAAISAAEWDRVRSSRPQQIEKYWREYLLGEDGIGFDVLTLSPAYRDFVRTEVGLLEPAGKRVLDLGAGTGNVARLTAEFAPAELVCLDIVPEALERLREKLGPGRLVETIVANADGGPLVAIRRWLDGELSGLAALAGRIPGVHDTNLGPIVDHCTPRLHALLRGAPLDPKRTLREAGLGAASEPLVSDLGLLARVVRGRVSIADAARKLRHLPASVVTQERGLPFPALRFDAIICSLVLSYLDHPADALSEMRRVLVPGGTLVLSSMRPDADCSKLFLELVTRLESVSGAELPSGTDRDVLLRAARSFASGAASLLRLEEEGVFRFYGADELVALLEEAGFDSFEVETSYGSPPQAVVVRCRRD